MTRRPAPPKPAAVAPAAVAFVLDPAASDRLDDSHAARYRALSTRDARFDGRFFTGVTSTGIYCRPVCSARTPRRENCRFFDLAAQAEKAGFRPCLRCRPELAPQGLAWSTQDASAVLAHQAARLLDEPGDWLGGRVDADENAEAPANGRDNSPRRADRWKAHDGAGEVGDARCEGSDGGDKAPHSESGDAPLLHRSELATMTAPAALGAPSSPSTGATAARLAARLGVSDRHLRRIFEAHFGVSPLQYLQTRRLLAAKQLLTDTALPITEVALAAGFGSQRRFNAAFLARYGMAPGALRRGRAGSISTVPASSSPVRTVRATAATVPTEHAGRSAADRDGGSTGTPAASTVIDVMGSHRPAATWTACATVQLAYRPPYDVPALLAFARTHQVHATETVASHPGKSWVASTFQVESGGRAYAGWVHADFDAATPRVTLRVAESLLPVLPLVLRRVRAWLDLDADPEAIDQWLRPHFPNGHGLRVPGTLDGFGLAVRAVLGQQVTVAAARTLAQRLVDRYGAPIDTPVPGLARLFPTPAVLAEADTDTLGGLGIVRQRQAAIVALARAVAGGHLQLHTGADVQQTLTALVALPGIGPWTGNYIAMRALGWPDAFLAADVALHKALGLLGTPRPAVAAEAASQAWRPWRSYAVMRAWASLSLPIP